MSTIKGLGKGLSRILLPLSIFRMNERHSHGKKMSFDSSFTKEGDHLVPVARTKSFAASPNSASCSFFFSFLFCSFIIIRKTRRGGGKEARPLSEQPKTNLPRAQLEQMVLEVHVHIDRHVQSCETGDGKRGQRQTVRIHLPGKTRRSNIIETGK